jgi:uncharacterized NAD-dependent epimerase/dehydratase family protein
VLNTQGLRTDAADAAIAEMARTTGVPVTDPVRSDPSAIIDALR